jgi:hypothetical protein
LRDIPVLDQMGDVRLHVLRWDAPRVSRHQNGLLAAFGNGRPELPVENLAMRLDHHPRFGHLVFVRTKNFAEIFNFGVHAVEHLPHGVDFDFAAFKPLQRKANRQMLCQFHENGFVRLAFRSLRRESGDGSPQRVLRGPGQLGHLLLENTSCCSPALPRAYISKTR